MVRVERNYLVACSPRKSFRGGIAHFGALSKSDFFQV